MSRIDDLLRGPVAYMVASSLMRDAKRELRELGKPLPPWVMEVVTVLGEAAGQPLPPGLLAAVSQQVERLDETAWVSAAEAAQQVPYSERSITRLASEGAVIARRVGARTWQIDLDSLKNVIRRRHEQNGS